MTAQPRAQTNLRQYRLYLFPDRGPVISVNINWDAVKDADELRPSATHDGGVHEIIWQIQQDPRCARINPNDPRSQEQLRIIINYMGMIARLPGMVVYTPGEIAGSGSSPDEIKRINEQWQQTLDEREEQHRQELGARDQTWQRRLKTLTSQFDDERRDMRGRITTLETQRQEAIAAQMRAEQEYQLAATTIQAKDERIGELEGQALHREHADAQASNETAELKERLEDAHARVAAMQQQITSKDQAIKTLGQEIERLKRPAFSPAGPPRL